MAHHFNLDMYATFLTANGNRYSGVEASKALSLSGSAPAHDTISRWLASASYEPDDLWEHVREHVALDSCLILDDTLLDKRFSPNNELADWHWSGNQHKVARGISLINLLATRGDDCIPVDYRVNGGSEKKSKNAHFIDMLDTAEKRGFTPRYVMSDCWYSSLENMKNIARRGWNFIMGIKENRKVIEEQGNYVNVSALDWTETPVRKVWLKGFGFVLVIRIVFKNGDTRYACTNDLTLTDHETFASYSKMRWAIEEFHRGIKQTTGIEKCYSVKERSQLTHIFASFVAFVKLELERLRSGLSWYEQKAQQVRLGIAQVFA
jgi:putative transposase